MSVTRDRLRRTPEQMALIRDRFKPDGLLRLAHSTADYYDQKGYYLPDVAAVAYENGIQRDALREALAAYRSALRSGEPETDQLRAVGDAALEWTRS